MLREKECNLKPRIYKVEYLEIIDSFVEEKRVYYEAETIDDAKNKWLSEYQNEISFYYVRCTEVQIQWN